MINISIKELRLQLRIERKQGRQMAVRHNLQIKRIKENNTNVK